MTSQILSSPHSAAKRLRKRTKTRDEFSQEAADAATLEGYCRTAVHDFAPHPVARKQFMYWGSKTPEAACLMLVQRYDDDVLRVDAMSHYVDVMCCVMLRDVM